MTALRLVIVKRILSKKKNMFMVKLKIYNLPHQVFMQKGIKVKTRVHLPFLYMINLPQKKT